MRNIQGIGVYADIVDGLSPVEKDVTIKLGIRNETFRNYLNRRLRSAVAQYYGIVQDQLKSAEHTFRGLRRPLMLADDTHADQNVLIYSWCPQYDYEWIGSQFEGQPTRMEPLPGRVFVVLVREEPPNTENVIGSIERWNWVEEDTDLPGAPLEWSERYEEKLWSRIE